MRNAILVLLLGWGIACCAVTQEQQSVLKQLKLPPGFSIQIFADKVPSARELALGKNGLVFVGSRAGYVYALQDVDGDGVAERRYTLASGLNLPTGVAYKEGDLYIAEVSRIIRLRQIEQALESPPTPEVVFDQFPNDQHHGWKYLRFGPDGKLYTAIGAPCNICQPIKSIYTSLIRLSTDNRQLEILATGIRNSVGFDWAPETGYLFFNDNGRDYLGDDLPPDELNVWTQIGAQYGFPRCHGTNIPDPQFAGGRGCSEVSLPAWNYPAHVAPLGMRFYLGSQFPAEYYQQLFVAQHGSWNRSEPQGYQVSLIRFSGGIPQTERAFVVGWLTNNGKILGRPVDVMEWKDGSLLISDDHLGVIYRVQYQK